MIEEHIPLELSYGMNFEEKNPLFIHENIKLRRYNNNSIN
jgi:hypothetical protein